MGFMRWAWKHSATRQMLKPAPKPKRAMATVGGKTHRLVWADRNAGWRFRCTCGWIDPKVRWTERNAINAGNGHIRSVRSVRLVKVGGVAVCALLVVALRSQWKSVLQRRIRMGHDRNCRNPCEDSP
jgi:hypothetical protein